MNKQTLPMPATASKKKAVLCFIGGSIIVVAAIGVVTCVGLPIQGGRYTLGRIFRRRQARKVGTNNPYPPYEPGSAS